MQPKQKGKSEEQNSTDFEPFGISDASSAYRFPWTLIKDFIHDVYPFQNQNARTCYTFRHFCMHLLDDMFQPPGLESCLAIAGVSARVNSD